MSKIAFVYTSNNYSIFKKLEGNREIFEKRKRAIIDSIRENGWIRNPIIVNEKMEIIDGQGRFEALKELNLPIEYVVAKGADISTCIALNVKQKNWSSNDYIECYAQNGNYNYIKLKELLETYKLEQQAVAMMAGRLITDGSKNQSIKNGTFEITDEQNLYKRMEFLKESLNLIPKNCGRRRSWVKVIKMIFYSKLIDNDIFLEKLKKYNSLVTPCVNSKQVIECFEKIYNYNSKKEKVYFLPEYEKWVKKQ